jgi:hypothetical protein
MRAWRDARLKTIDEIAKPKAALEFATVPGREKINRRRFRAENGGSIV